MRYSDISNPVCTTEEAAKHIMLHLSDIKMRVRLVVRQCPEVGRAADAWSLCLAHADPTEEAGPGGGHGAWPPAPPPFSC